MEKRNRPMSVEQKEILIEFIRSHPELKQKFSSTFSRQEYIGLWKDITNILNGTPGAKKDWKEWRKSWHDIQSRTKTKKAQINAHFLRTGGGPAVADLSEADEKIIGIIGDTAIRGLLGVVEPQVQEIGLENDNPTKMTGKENDTNTPNSPVQKDVFIRVNEENVNPHSSKKIKRKNVATQRLDKAVEQNNRTIDLLQEKIQIKKEYYTKKLLIMERDVKAKENIASELQDMKRILLEKFSRR